MAVVVPKPEYKGKIIEDELRNHLMKFVEQEVIPKWWIPDKFEFVDSIPKTSVGKKDKKVLREKYKDVVLP
ncbi:MAG: AMP-binding enzyme [Candidatus Baldrarchaeia archaeon]